MHYVVGVEHADDLCLRRCMLECQSECASLEALLPINAQEFKARPKQSAMILDRRPESWIGGVIDHHHAFEIGPVELRNAVERLTEHIGRLAAGRDVNRDERLLLR